MQDSVFNSHAAGTRALGILHLLQEGFFTLEESVSSEVGLDLS